MIQNRCFGLVLAGGESKRMGTDKSQLTYHHLPQREHVAGLLEKFCAKVFISVRNPESITSFPVLSDIFPSEGPLTGIVTAISARPDVAWLFAPVDMPWLDEETIDFLINNRLPGFEITCFTDASGKLPEPLLSIWEPFIFTEVLKYYEEGGRSVLKFIETRRANLITAPHPEKIKNVNTPEQLNQFYRKRK
ncbi:MAG: molybdenum cofactor guanylyltransferase [Cyclobacteriaceae bacterium]|nr:molybdenum cofactor guanylyltransferase [Cyclobacteriaceae bacterium]MCX7638039.1 molybdenum cofactor guanylyltransferase [Cyclobacteriaceae bacterium]MDW8332113.1 molybdenum cofactor guanylyltransferase [Cyclobacteriaceae bacterium]